MLVPLWLKSMDADFAKYLSGESLNIRWRRGVTRAGRNGVSGFWNHQ